ncbi:aliphatic sulfonate ABC transporter substrate-binding protein [Chelatococcus sambhunathii]|uniref:Aliphatic sulfonate ABC transporter substrate-binding protein n=1 Tax=Chelatococcus sambhunathii TaxID=363953 RepID=A0ABU1DCV1_9HYPH|nr:aliphatic sulfonate ABC transporter substrate-binding protein [Chelatococcus sambhunathii]MDR4305750.1 aliphatic sulfonate ABC transporter substrate-binding protein [Chelatococcus sambhunathii]
MSFLSRRAALLAPLLAAMLCGAAAAAPSEIRLDWATYSPVSIALKENGFLEKALEADGIKVRWVQSLGSNKALEFLNAGSLDFGSSASAAALIARLNGNPVKSVYVYSRAEWTALVTKPDSGINGIADLKGKRVAVTRGTDPHIFLIRAFAHEKLSDKDVKLVLLQHADGRLALQRGDVDAWMGLDPMMASAELQDGAKLAFRDPSLNSWGSLNVREAFAAENPALVDKVLKAYDQARTWSLEHPKELSALLAKAAKLPEDVVARQLERTTIKYTPISDADVEAVAAAGEALAQAGVLPAETDVKKVTGELIDRSFDAKLTN